MSSGKELKEHGGVVVAVRSTISEIGSFWCALARSGRFVASEPVSSAFRSAIVD